MPDRADLADIDRRILAAFAAVNEARARFHLSPCGEIVTACEHTEAVLNELLDLRYSLTGGPQPLASAA